MRKKKNIVPKKNAVSKKTDVVVVKQEEHKGKKISWVGRAFQWLDDNILSKTTRLLMYVLECAGVVAIFIIIYEFRHGIALIEIATDDFSLKKAESIVGSVKDFASPLAIMVTTICGAIPTVMGVFRSLKKKWGVDKDSIAATAQAAMKDATS